MPQIIPGLSNAGVVVLETGRIFGGDAQYYYVGTYSVNDSKIVGQATITYFNGPRLTAFGTHDHLFEIEMEITLHGRTATGHMWRKGSPTQKLPIQLEFRAELP